MSNLEKYTHIFTEVFRIEPSELGPAFAFREVAAWDSVAHMELISAMEDGFDILLDTEDILELTSFEAGKKILSKYGVSF